MAKIKEVATQNKVINIASFLLGLVAILWVGLENLPWLRNIQVINDEFGYWSIAAHMAGHDWTGLTPSSPYYSYGYSLILVPLFWIFENPVHIYQAAIVLNVLMLCLSYYIAVKMAGMLFPDTPVWLRHILCALLIFYPNTIAQSQIAWSETLLYTLYWVETYMILKYVLSSKKRYLVLSLIVAIYGYAVHQRTLGVLIATIVIVGVAILRYVKVDTKKWYISLGVIVIGIVGLMLVSFVKNYFVDEVWINNELVGINDYSGQVSKIASVFSVEGFIKLLESVIGKTYYLMIASVFLVAFGVIYVVKQTTAEVVDMIKKKKFEIRVGTFYTFVILASLLELGISSVYMINATRMDTIIYGRYTESIMGPLLLLGLFVVVNCLVGAKEIFISMILAGAGSLVVNNVLLELKSNSFNGYCATSVYSYFYGEKYNTGAVYHLTAIVSLIVVFYIFFMLSKRIKTRNIGIVIYCIMILGMWNGNTQDVIDTLILKWQDEIRSGMSEISAIIREESESDTVYYVEVDDETYKEDHYAKQMQFAIYDYKIERLPYSEYESGNFDKEAFLIIPPDSKVYYSVLSSAEIVEHSDIWTLVKYVE